ncbi:hypothetical protein Q5M85_02880 [Paraclostridium bifermentans]|nr:hypothetical protein [Paraclostridium bifermentans]
MGVAGAAYATVIAQGVSGVLCLFYTAKKISYIKTREKHFKFDSVYFKKYLGIGIQWL